MFQYPKIQALIVSLLPVNSADGLTVVTWIPGGVKDDHPVGSHQVDPEAPRPGGDKEEQRLH